MVLPNPIVGWDVETHLIRPGNKLPKQVCASFNCERSLFDSVLDGLLPTPAPGGTWVSDAVAATRLEVDGTVTAVVAADVTAELLVLFAEAGAKLVAHNGAFDWSILLHERPDVLPRLVEWVENDQVTDTRIREMLFCIATDNFKYDRRTQTKDPAFSLAYVAEVRLRRKVQGKAKTELQADGTMKVVGDASAWRLRYSELDGVPLDQWPAAALAYAGEDAALTRNIYLAQSPYYGTEVGVVVTEEGEVVDEYNQQAADLVLYDMAAHGPRIDPARLAKVEAVWKREYAKAAEAGAKAGFMVINRCKACEGTGILLTGPEAGPLTRSMCRTCGGADHATALARGVYKLKAPPKSAKSQTRMHRLTVAAYHGHPPQTPTGKPQTGAKVWRAGRDKLLADYAKGASVEKLITTYLPILQEAVKTRVTSEPMVLRRTGRTSWRKPNLQNPPKTGGFRECFIPFTDGNVFASIDWSMQELCCLGQVCLAMFGYSTLADAINSGREPHLMFAASMMRIPYDLAVKAYKDKTHELHAAVKAKRQEAKAANFGFPGGLGAKAFMEYAKGYRLTLSLEQATALRDAWFEQWPEVKDYMRHFKSLSGSFDNPTYFRVQQLGSNRVRGGCSYTSGANTMFQGLAADAGKAAMWSLWKAIKLPGGRLFGMGVHMWAFIHDEFLIEGPHETADAWARICSDIMVETMALYTPDVVSKAEPALMDRWTKDADPMYDAEERLKVLHVPDIQDASHEDDDTEEEED